MYRPVIKIIFLILVGMIFSGLFCVVQAGIYSICKDAVPSKDNWQRPEWTTVKSVEPVQWRDNSVWTLKKEEILKLLRRRDLEVYTHGVWSLDDPVTFVGKVRYQNGKIGMVAIAEHRVCLTDGDKNTWFFQWNEKIVPR